MVATLELDADALRGLAGAVLERLDDYLSTLPVQTVSSTAGAEEVATGLRGSLPTAGRPLAEVLDFLFGEAIPRAFNPASPGYLAYVPGGGLPHAAVADLLAGVVNRFTGVRAAAPALAEVEAQVVRFLASVVGYPEGARGFLTSGGSLANRSALVTARRERLGESERVLRATLYASDQVHHAVLRAAVLAGFPAAHVRRLASDGRFRLDPATLRAAIDADRAAGLEPFLVTASAGTTNTGAVDPLLAIGEVAVAESLWFHVDAAYGGCFGLTVRGRAVLAGIERADSVVLDPHKGFFLPYGTGALLVRDGEALRRAHHLAADYLPPESDPELVDFHALSPELSRPFRGLRLWLPLQLVGTAAFGAALDEKLDLAAWIAGEIAAIPELELVAPPELSLLAFAPRLPAALAARWRAHLGDPAAHADAAGCADLAAELAPHNAITRALGEAINAPQRVYLTGTRVAEREVIRVCVLSFRTHRERLEMARDDIRAAVSRVLAGGDGAAPRAPMAGVADER